MIESLEERLILSVSALVRVIGVPARFEGPGTVGFGRAAGVYSTVLVNAPTQQVVGSNPEDLLTGVGIFAKTRIARVNGAIEAPPVASPSATATGTLTLSDRRGSLTLNLEGPVQALGADPVSGDYQYTIATQTGTHAHFPSTGTIALRLNSHYSRFAMSFRVNQDQ